MQCPIDGNELKITERQGIEIDYCPVCRGVWLDRGELDKIVERSAAQFGAHVAQPQTSEWGEKRDRRYSEDDDDRYKPRKRKSFLDDIFDF